MDCTAGPPSLISCSRGPRHPGHVLSVREIDRLVHVLMTRAGILRPGVDAFSVGHANADQVGRDLWDQNVIAACFASSPDDIDPLEVMSYRFRSLRRSVPNDEARAAVEDYLRVSSTRDFLRSDLWCLLQRARVHCVQEEQRTGSLV